MKNKILVIIIVVLLVVIGGLVFFFLGNKNETINIPTTNSPGVSTPQETPSKNLSEQPNQAKFDEYFSDKIILGKLAFGVQVGPPNGIPQETEIFDSSKDQFCTMMTLKKTIPIGSFADAIYNTVSKKYTQPQSVFGIELRQGGSAGCEPVPVPTGKYEYKIYVDNVLVSVLPFEVK